MIKLKEPVKKSFLRLSDACVGGKLTMSASELKKNGVINASEPMVHLKKMVEVGLISFVSRKEGNRNPLDIVILKNLEDLNG